MNILITFNHAPYQSSFSNDSLDLALAMAAFDYQVTLLFINQGVWNLSNTNHPKHSGLKDFTRLFKGLDLYDIEEVFVEKSALEQYHLDINDLLCDVDLLSPEQLGEFINRFDRVVQL
ncbi:MAG: sulfurtransferase complex subunit TusC [Kangiellaceae bacterium]|jgi:tRNA 2-thiouridine synthesizing protein C|nr:sulfurtransferase complex subunit TusC [Kangiellaceae bacterium]